MNRKSIEVEGKTILITGVAGFIGSFLAKHLIKTVKGIRIIGIDNLNDYYDINLKQSRLESLLLYEKFIFYKISIADKEGILEIFRKYRPDIAVNLAAQAGVRYSITNPDAYIESNIIGFFNILEACRQFPVEHLVFASSSSVYGTNSKIPYSVLDNTDNPVSLYAATKKSNELMAHAYSKLYGIPATGLRFFTVYGPAGRPDMAYFSFTEKMVKRESIQIYNYGDMKRDFTYIDDIVLCIASVIQKCPEPKEDGAEFKIYNIGNNHPEGLMYFVEVLEKCLREEGVIHESVHKQLLPMQQGDVYQTYADIDDFIKEFDFKPETSLEAGLKKFAIWYRKEYKMMDDPCIQKGC